MDGINLTLPFNGMTQNNISQIFHPGHEALDIWNDKTYFGYGTPLCAPEDCLVLGIRGDQFTPTSSENFLYGYGIRLKGIESGMEYLYWHCLPYFPVWGGERVKRGQIVAWMGNSGSVFVSGQFVPLEKRDQLPLDPNDPEEAGLHVHWEMYKDGKRIDPLPYLNWNWQPQYTYFELLTAVINSVKKIAKAVV